MSSHVLILCEYSSLNGGEQSLLSVLDGVQQRGFRITIAAPPEGPLASALRERDVEVEPFCIHDTSGTRRARSELRDNLQTIIVRRQPNAVHANSLSMSRLCGPVAAELGIPCIGHLRDIIKVSAATIDDLNCHTRLLAVSHATRDWYTAAGLDATKTHVLYNGVDLDRFQPRAATGYLHRELGLPPHAQLIGSIGQIGMRKGLDVLLEAAQTIVRQHADAHFLIVGERHSEKDEAVQFEQQLHRAASTAPLAGHVHFVGRRNDVDRLLNELTLLVHAARQEPLGRVLLEAAASGVPIIATDVGGTREIFPSASNAARLVPVNDSIALASSIADLLNNRNLRRELACDARSRAAQAFNARSSAEALVGHYAEVIG
jgi:glycosyltransferase involved in cell wall biosynthesis